MNTRPAAVRQLGARRQMLYYGTGIILMKAVSVLMLPVVTHYLTPSEYGILDVLLTWMNLLSIVLGLGFTDVLYRFSQQENSQQATAGLLVRLHQGLLLPVLLLATGLLLMTSSWLPVSLPVPLLLLSLWAAGFASALSLPLCLLRMRDRADWFFYCTAGKALLQALLCWLFLKAGWGLVAVLYASLISHLLLLVLLLNELPSKGPFWQWGDQQRSFLRYGWPLVLSGLCLFLVCGAERWIIAAVLNTDDLAQYAIASQFALMVAVSIEPFTLWWYPKRMAMLVQRQGLQRVANTATIGVVLSLAAATALGTAGPLLIAQFLPASYHNAALLLPWLCLAMALKQCSHLLNTGCYTGENTRQVGKINAWLAAVAPGLYLLGCWYGGLTGLLAALILLYSARLIWFYLASQRLLMLPYPNRILSLSLAASCALLLFAPHLGLAYMLSCTAMLLGVLTLCLWWLWRMPATSGWQELCE